MGNVRKRRTSRRKLAAHDRGDNRHSKAVAYFRKAHRLKDEWHRGKAKHRGGAV